MSIPGLNPSTCARRNRLAALRGYAAGEVRLLAARPATDESLARGAGRLPKDEAAALAMINALRTGGEPLTADQVWLHYAEAANANFIPDRYMFLAGTTLRNVAADAERGVAFMNSHRTGGLSEPTELPFGRTFCGRYEETGGGGQRAVVGLYMTRGDAPNGANGPTTDTLHAMIDAGTLFDVSVGLYGGWYLCDVCGQDFQARDEEGDYLCHHLPGTHYEMQPAEIKSQKARGVTEGRASVTYTDGHMGEVSGVYDGAVPGAGFVKAVSLARDGRLDGETLSRCRVTYERLCRASDFSPRTSLPLSPSDLSSLVALFPGDPDGAPAAPSFEQQLEAALAAVDGCIARAEQLQTLRARDGRSLSGGRRAQLRQVAERLAALQTRYQGPGPEQQRLAVQALAMREQALSLLQGV